MFGKFVPFHAHRCGCGTVWSHKTTTENHGSVAEHTCPQCSAVVWMSTDLKLNCGYPSAPPPKWYTDHVAALREQRLEMARAAFVVRRRVQAQAAVEPEAWVTAPVRIPDESLDRPLTGRYGAP